MNELTPLLSYIQKTIDLQSARLPEEYYYASLPLCIIDAVFSINARYESTKATVKRWCNAQQPAWQVFGRSEQASHTINELIGLLERSDFESLARNMFGNRQRTSPRAGILKAEAIYRFANVLRDFGIDGFGDTENSERNERVATEICKIPGQGSGISYTYFLMLAGSDEFVKADRMLCRYVTDAIGVVTDITPRIAQDSVIAACAELKKEDPNLTPRLLDYKIWEFQRKNVKRQ